MYLPTGQLSDLDSSFEEFLSMRHWSRVFWFTKPLLSHAGQELPVFLSQWNENSQNRNKNRDLKYLSPIVSEEKLTSFLIRSRENFVITDDCRFTFRFCRWLYEIIFSPKQICRPFISKGVETFLVSPRSNQRSEDSDFMEKWKPPKYGAVHHIKWKNESVIGH